mmetsp:Transcript_13185/g.39694  ORF Transcript_13185/g.39694 Transcript_13185/m.39694 type:complete len:187 (-) Transcript_13185:517-1077(-)
MLTGMPRTRSPSREEAQLLMSIVHKAHSNGACNSPSQPSLPPAAHVEAGSPPLAPPQSQPPEAMQMSHHSWYRTDGDVLPSGYRNYASQIGEAAQVRAQTASPIQSPSAAARASPSLGTHSTVPLDSATAKKIEKKKGNRLAAKRCRERKKQYISFLESRCVDLEASIQALQAALRQIHHQQPRSH